MDIGFRKMLILSTLFHATVAAVLLAFALSRSTHPFSPHAYQVDLVTLPQPSAAPPAPVKEIPAAPPPPAQKPPSVRVNPAAKKSPVQPPPKAIKPAATVPPPARAPRKSPEAAPQKETAPAAPNAAASENVSAIAPAAKLQTKIEIPDFKFPYYTDMIQRKIELYWSPPPLETTADATEAVVGFVLFSTGKVGDPRIEKSSGNAYFDQAALRAVYLANPLPPFPQGFRDPSMTVHFRFALTKKS
ncbi:MAG TPA: energy transducer TonB [Nitrospiria bacterium]|nr:energy transducer TonB [Nitrospiria bacterium]